MKTDRIFGSTMAILQRSLDLRSRNQQLIVSNLANADTPNYKAFKMIAANKVGHGARHGASMTMARTDNQHMAPRRQAGGGQPIERISANPHSIRGDGNTVELEKEMSNLAENTLMYNTATRLVANKFNLLKSVIKGGG